MPSRQAPGSTVGVRLAVRRPERCLEHILCSELGPWQLHWHAECCACAVELQQVVGICGARAGALQLQSFLGPRTTPALPHTGVPTSLCLKTQ